MKFKFTVIFFGMILFLSARRKMLSDILIFLNVPLVLFVLQKRFLMAAKLLHSIKMCLTVVGVCHGVHSGWFSCLSKKEC